MLIYLFNACVLVALLLCWPWFAFYAPFVVLPVFCAFGASSDSISITVPCTGSSVQGVHIPVWILVVSCHEYEHSPLTGTQGRKRCRIEEEKQ
jgi:hypothetical protein